jgi:hypothetical protein
MRAESLFLGAIAIVTVGLIATRGGRRRPPLLGTLTKKIVIDVTRNGDSLDIDVTPSCAEIREGQEVTWEHNVDHLQVVPKGGWPYLHPPTEAGKGVPARSGPMRPYPTLNRAFPYLLILRKQWPGHPPRTEVIKLDPDIIIRDDNISDH